MPTEKKTISGNSNIIDFFVNSAKYRPIDGFTLSNKVQNETEITSIQGCKLSLDIHHLQPPTQYLKLFLFCLLLPIELKEYLPVTDPADKFRPRMVYTRQWCHL